MKNILIFGASGHAKMIIDIIEKNNNYRIKGFIDSYKPLNEVISDYKIIGRLNDIPDLIKVLNIDGIVIAIGDNYTRQKVTVDIKNVDSQLKFVSIIHPSAVIASDVIIDDGSVIMANTVVNAGAKIGKNCIINTASTLGHDSVMQDFSSLASGVTIAGGVKIGICSAICLRAILIQNIVIGNNTVIGAGSLVLKSIGNLKQAFGSPIDTIKDRKANSKYLG